MDRAGNVSADDRNHAAKGTRDREPWVDGPEHEAIRKKFIEERYRLLPYIYASMEETSRTGVPLMRPMFLNFPDDERMYTHFAAEQYMFGRDLLIAPPTKNFYGGYNALLPHGTWYDYWTGQPVVGKDTAGTDDLGIVVHLDPKLDELPVLVRAGAVIPRQPLVQNTSQTPRGPLELRVYPGAKCSGDLYADDGQSFGYQRGEFFRTSVACEDIGSGLHFKIAPAEGKYTPWWKSYAVVFYGQASAPGSVKVNGGAASNVKYDANAKSVTVEVPYAAGGAEVVLAK